MTTRLPPLTHKQLTDLYRKCVSLGAVLADSSWTPPPTTAAELIQRIRKEAKP